MWVYDISNPTSPSLTASYSLTLLAAGTRYNDTMYQVCYDGIYLYTVGSNTSAVASFQRVFYVFDARDWTNVTFVGSYVSGLEDAQPCFTAIGCYPNGWTDGNNFEVL
jgi:hypothetical protein